MKTRKPFLFIFAGISAALAVAIAIHAGHKNLSAHRMAISKEAPLPTAERDLRNYVSKNAGSTDPKVQDRVGSARIRIGYAVARKGLWAEARTTFQQTVKEYRGTGAVGADFGGIPDAAAYQAAVCAEALESGKAALPHAQLAVSREVRPEPLSRGQAFEHPKAVAGYEGFIKTYPLSPLTHAAYKRLVRLNGGERKQQWDDLLQSCVTKQEAHIRFETSVCGPKTIAYLIDSRLLAAKKADYKEIARLCHTKDSGTTLAGMREGLSALGVQSFSYKLNRQDLTHAPMPAILLEKDHFVALLRVENDRAKVYDTRFKSEQTIPLPKLDDPDFTATVVLFRRPNLQGKS